MCPRIPRAEARFQLPKNIRNITLEDLVNMPGTEVYANEGRITMRKCTSDGVITFSHRSYETGFHRTTMSSTSPVQRKMDYLDDIRRMKKEGMKQKDIAFELGVSEAYISQLLRK